MASALVDGELAVGDGDGQGIYHLKPIMPPSEQGVTRDTVFDLAYWRWGLDQAQRWREHMGLPRQPHWDELGCVTLSAGGNNAGGVQ
jgi:hypothetical protein